MATRNYKLVLLGDSAVGKSSIVNRFVKDEFLQYQQPTVGAAFMTNSIEMSDGSIVKLEIWDTAGQERYRSLAPMYYRGAAAALVVFDLTDAKSFQGAKSWIQELYTQGSPDIVLAIAGNKSDMVDKRIVSSTDVNEYCGEYGCIYLETSAKTGDGIRELFREIAKRLPLRSSVDEPEDLGVVSFKQESSSQGWCCA